MDQARILLNNIYDFPDPLDSEFIEETQPLHHSAQLHPENRKVSEVNFCNLENISIV
jgi:hypothetical protein